MPRKGTIIDLSSLTSILRHIKNGNLISPEGTKYYKHILKEGSHGFKEIFDVLCSIICSETIYLDGRAIRYYEEENLLVDVRDKYFYGIFEVVDIRIDEYERAARKVADLRNIIVEAGGSTKLERAFGINGQFYDSTLHFMHDGRQNDGGKPPLKDRFSTRFADTGDTIERIYVYLEVASALDLPILFSSQKKEILSELGQRVSVYVENYRGSEYIQDILAKEAFPEEIVLPLLPSYIIRVADERNISLVEAALEIRQQEPAIAFRDYLWENRKAFNSDDAPGHLRRRRMEEQIKTIAKRISERGLPIDIFKESVVVPSTFLGIPTLDFLLSALNNRIQIPRRPPLYEIFIARWFQ